MNKRIIIDCDPGIDDCFALLLCIKHLDVVAITTVGGNTQLNFTHKNARYLTELTQRTDIPVYAGYDKPMFTKLRTAAEVHGSGGLGNLVIPDPQKELETEHAVDYLVDAFLHQEGITLLTLGPLTNIAQAILKEPRLKEKITEIYVMGGSVTCGNFNAAAEFNIYVDPEAAKIVFESGIPIYMVGLNLTRQNCMTFDDVRQLEMIGNSVSRFAAELLQYSVAQDRSASLCDACTAAWLIDPSIITKSLPLPVVVETKGEFTKGMTLCDCRDYMGTDPKVDIAREVQFENLRAEPNVTVAMEFDQSKFKKLLFDTIAMYRPD